MEGPAAARRRQRPQRPQRPSRLAPAARRQQILGTAKRLVESGEIQQISVEAVAASAGVSPGLLFHYFGSQSKFRRAVIEEIARGLLTQIEPDPALSAIEQLHAGLETFIGCVARSPGPYLAVVRTVDQELVDLHRSLRSALAALLVSGLSNAGAPIIPAITATITGWLAFTEEVILGWLADPAMPQAELVALCERACLRLLEAAVRDPAERNRLTTALHRPGDAQP